MECLSAVVLVFALIAAALAWGALREARAAQRAIAALRTEVAALRRESRGWVEQEIPAAEAAPIAAPPPPPATVPEPAAAAPPIAAPEPPALEPPVPAAAPEPFLTQPSFSPPPPPAPTLTLEERLGARAFVWIGAVALALAGAFLVKYSVDQGWIGPTVRFTLAVLFGVALLGAGEALRRRADRIASGLSAAGIAVLFAAWLAGVNLYGLISPAVGFVFILLTALVAVWLSLRQGLIVALVGLVGGFATPALLQSPEPDARALFAYLLLVQVGVLAVARRQDWGRLGELSVVGGLLWVVGWANRAYAGGDELWLGLFLAASLGAVLLAGRHRRAAAPALAAVGAVLAMAMVTSRAGFSPLAWAFLALLLAACLALARLREELHVLAWLAAGAVIALLADWGFDLPPEAAPRFLWTALAIGALCAGGGYLAHHGALRPDRWTALAAASGLAVFVLAWASVEREGPDLPWGALALAAAALYLVAALPVARRRAAAGEGTPFDAALAWLAVAVTGFVSLAVPLELERQWWTVAWALEVPALVWLAGRFRLPALRGLAVLLAAGVAVRLLANPMVLSYTVGSRPILNGLLYGYGLPLLAIAGAAALARRDLRRGEGASGTFGTDRLAPGFEWLALALGFALATLEVRHLFHPRLLAELSLGLAEWGTYTVVWSLLGLVLMVVGARRGLVTLDRGGQALLVLGLGGALVGSGFFANPLWNREPVGETPVVNLLLWLYGAPALIAALAGRELRRRGKTRAAVVFSTGALVLAFLLVTLEVTQAFHGTYLADEPATVAEKYAYSLVWLVFGVALLVLGIARRVRALRYASLAVMALTVVKVFLFDTGNLTDLWRVLSFLGLGLSLLLLAFLYQRFVFREPAA